MELIASWSKEPIRSSYKTIHDIFFRIQTKLGADHRERKGTLHLSVGSLSIEFEREIKNETTGETIRICKKWKSVGEEKITYFSSFNEPKAFEAREKEQMKTGLDGDLWYQAHLKGRTRDKYLSREMLIDSVHIKQIPWCKLEYATDNLGRGLQSFAHLKIFSDDPDKEYCQKEFPLMYEEMERKAEWALKGQLGEDRRKWRRSIRQGKIDVRLPYKKEILNALPPWVVGAQLVELCKTYAAGEADKRRP